MYIIENKIKTIMNLKKLLILILFFTPIISIAQTADFIINTPTLCEGDSIEFESISSPTPDNLHWFFGDASETWTRKTPKHRYLTSGNYTVKLEAIFGDVIVSKEMQITIEKKPALQISVVPNIKIINLGEKATLSVSNGFLDYLWSTGQTIASIEVYKQDYYWVKVYDNNNCSNSDTVFISVVQDDLFVTSNILTPNNDGYNDYLEISNLGKLGVTIQIYIYNIRNEQIYQNSDYQNDWDGNNYPAGSYFYLLKGTGRRDKTGTINILR